MGKPEAGVLGQTPTMGDLKESGHSPRTSMIDQLFKKNDKYLAFSMMDNKDTLRTVLDKQPGVMDAREFTAMSKAREEAFPFGMKGASANDAGTWLSDMDDLFDTNWSTVGQYHEAGDALREGWVHRMSNQLGEGKLAVTNRMSRADLPDEYVPQVQIAKDLFGAEDVGKLKEVLRRAGRSVEVKNRALSGSDTALTMKELTDKYDVNKDATRALYAIEGASYRNFVPMIATILGLDKKRAGKIFDPLTDVEAKELAEIMTTMDVDKLKVALLGENDIDRRASKFIELLGDHLYQSGAVTGAMTAQEAWGPYGKLLAAKFGGNQQEEE